ncbi:MAG TPA: 16S rRNA (cytidine(1402)-2'-O)-methyltransferase [bacterium]|nr:16S rRNA (cytidine(1402)-2'-O)-methyltransferase [bacterium]
MLYIVSTPIGNLEDISPRAIETLKSVHTILAEDTRHTRKLCSHYDIHTPLVSFHAHSSSDKAQSIIELLKEQDVALVSDAGTPGISDPGAELISKAIEAGITVSPIPGASAVTAALICTGFDLSRFVFLGYLPQKAGKQQKLIEKNLLRRCPIIMYESPHRIIKTLENLEPQLQRKQLVIARELTKKFEEFIRGDYSQVMSQIKKNPPRGEMTVIIN